MGGSVQWLVLYIIFYDVVIDENDFINMFIFVTFCSDLSLIIIQHILFDKPMVGDGQFDYQRGDCLDLDIGKKSCLPY